MILNSRSVEAGEQQLAALQSGQTRGRPHRGGGVVGILQIGVEIYGAGLGRQGVSLLPEGVFEGVCRLPIQARDPGLHLLLRRTGPDTLEPVVVEDRLHRGLAADVAHQDVVGGVVLLW